MLYQGFKIIVQRGGAVIVEGRTADGTVPRGCRKDIDHVFVGFVFKDEEFVDGWSARSGGACLVKGKPKRSWAVRGLVAEAVKAGKLATLRPLEEVR